MTTPIPPVGSTMPTAGTANAKSTTGAAQDGAQLSSQAFLKLLVAQLQYQDPSSPADMSAFMTQTATLNQMESMQQLTAATTQLLQNTQATQALALAGKTVTYTGTDGQAHTGTVGAISLGQTPTLTVGTDSVALSAVTSVLTA
jgi:flagellar basal-body rod modification protein FlgD